MTFQYTKRYKNNKCVLVEYYKSVDLMQFIFVPNIRVAKEIKVFSTAVGAWSLKSLKPNQTIELKII